MILQRWECPNCRRIYQIPITNLKITCTCNLSDHLPDIYVQRQKICEGCKYRIEKGCVLYIKPCTVKQLWHDQIESPTLCPNKEKFE